MRMAIFFTGLAGLAATASATCPGERVTHQELVRQGYELISDGEASEIIANERVRKGSFFYKIWDRLFEEPGRRRRKNLDIMGRWTLPSPPKNELWTSGNDEDVLCVYTEYTGAFRDALEGKYQEQTWPIRHTSPLDDVKSYYYKKINAKHV